MSGCGSDEVGALVRDLEAAVRCARCEQVVRESFSSSVCRHTFCGPCVEDVLAATPSRCPACCVPLWRHNVRFNPVLASVVQYVAALGQQVVGLGECDRQALPPAAFSDSETVAGDDDAHDELMVSPPLMMAADSCQTSPPLIAADSGCASPLLKADGGGCSSTKAEGDRTSPSWPAAAPSLGALQERHQQLVHSYAEMNLSGVFSSLEPTTVVETPICSSQVTEPPPPSKTIVFQTSGLASQKHDIHERLMALGATPADDVEECTHLIMAVDERRRCQRTLKYAVALLRGIWIVSDSWVVQCAEERRWVDEDDFEVVGDASVVDVSNAPQRSRLSLVAVFAGCDLALDEGSELPDLEPLIRLSGGRLVQPRPGADTGDNVVMVCEHGLSTKRAKQLAKHYDVIPISIAWLFDCCSHLERISYQPYRLDLP